MNDQKKIKTVLIADDDTDILEQARMILEGAGYSVAMCESRRQAEDYIAGSRPDISIVDLMMETNDAGFVLCYHIKKKYPDSPVIILTSATGETGIEFAATTPEERSWIKADTIVEKPVRPEQLIREVERLLYRNGSK
jgi:CheY-like chemotaxis protein